MHRFRLIVGCFALVIAMTGAACSSGGGDDPASKNPQAAMKAASQKTTGTGTVKLQLSAKDKANKTVLSGKGAYDFDKKQGRFTLTTQAGAAADMVITADELFLKLPQQTGTKPWVGITNAAADGAASSDAETSIRNYLESIRKQVDPKSTLDALGSGVADLKKIGTAKIRGTKTTHLRGRVDLSDKAIEAAEADKRETLREAQKAFGTDGYPVDVWFDSDGRVRRVEYVLESGTGAEATKTTVRLDLYDFGGKSGIVIPPASEVGDVSSLLPTTTTAPAKK